MKRKAWRKLISAGLVATMALSIIGCGSSSGDSGKTDAKNDGLTEVTFVSTTPIDTFDYLVSYVGIEMGYFEEEGIKVNLQQAQAGNDVKMVASGEANFCMPGPTLLFSSIDTGMDLISVYSQDPYNIFGVAYKAGGYSDWEDIKDSTMAIPAETLIPYGTPSFAKAGIDTATDINWVSLGDTRYTAVDTGEAEGVLTWLAEWGQMKGQGFDLEFMSFDEINPTVSNSIVTSKKFLEENPETVKGYLRAYAKSAYFMYCNPEAAADIILNACPTIEITWEGAVGAAESSMYQLFGETEEKQKAVLEAGIGAYDVERWQQTLEDSKEYGDIVNNKDITLEDVYDDSCLDFSWDKSEVEEDANSYEMSSKIYKDAQ